MISTSPGWSFIHLRAGIRSLPRISSTTVRSERLVQSSWSSVLPTVPDCGVTSTSVRYSRPNSSSAVTAPVPCGKSLRPHITKYSAHTPNTAAATVVKSKKPSGVPVRCRRKSLMTMLLRVPINVHCPPSSEPYAAHSRYRDGERLRSLHSDTMIGKNTSTTVVSLMNIEKHVVTMRIAACNSASLPAHARNNFVPYCSAMPVRTIAAPNTNIAVTITTATLPKPEKPSAYVRILFH